jgi:hypothetical protein
MSTDIDTTTHSTGTPTRTSTALSLVAGLAVVALLIWQVGLVLAPVVVGSLGALCFAVGLGLVGLDRFEPLARTLAGLLAVPVALGLLFATGGTTLLLFSQFFPVQDGATLSLLTLTLITQVGVVAGCVFAILGIMLGVRNVVDGEALQTQFWVTVQTAVVPAVVGVFLATAAVLARQNAFAIDIGIVDGIVRWLFVPSRLQTHLATALFLGALTLGTLRAAVGALPIAELVGDSGTGETDHDRVDTLRSLLGRASLLSGLLTLLAAAGEVVFPPLRLQRVLGLGLYRTLVNLSTAPGLRLLLILTTVVATATWLVVYLLRRLAANSTRDVATRVGPFGGGVAVTLACLVVGRPVVDTTISQVGARLPSPFDDTFFRYARDIVDFFGAPTLVMMAVTLLLGVALGLILFFRFAVLAGYLSDETAGYSLASGGLFVAAAFAGVLVTQAWVLFAALVGSFFVWDMGRYGTTMGAEMGRGAETRDAELVHAGGTLSVGLLGVGGAYGIQRLLDSGSIQQTPTAIVALVGVLAGIVFLVTALR